MNELSIIEKFGYKIVEKNVFPSKEAEYVNVFEYQLSDHTKKYLSLYNYLLYKHQFIAIEHFKLNNNICISTSTNSGKSLVFYVCAIEILSINKIAKILAIYPLKALGSQQEKNWINAINNANLNCKVGLIDGDTSIDERVQILKNSNVIIITPDVIHSWLLLRLDLVHIQEFIKNLELIIVDEIHAYTGVFGSNSAYLFRRLNHAVSVLKGNVSRFITASATIENPNNFLDQLFGLSFEIIDNSIETSGKHEVECVFLESIETKDIISNVSARPIPYCPPNLSS